SLSVPPDRRDLYFRNVGSCLYPFSPRCSFPASANALFFTLWRISQAANSPSGLPPQRGFLLANPEMVMKGRNFKRFGSAPPGRQTRCFCRNNESNPSVQRAEKPQNEDDDQDCAQHA